MSCTAHIYFTETQVTLISGDYETLRTGRLHVNNLTWNYILIVSNIVRLT